MLPPSQLFAWPRLRPHALFAAFALLSIALFQAPLRQLASLSLADERYTHILLIPFIAAFFVYTGKPEILARAAFRPGAGPLLFLTAALAVYGLLALRILRVPQDLELSIVILAILLSWLAGFAVFYGPRAFKAALFPLLFLLLLTPMPLPAMDKIVTFLQSGSAGLTHALFRLAGVPVFRIGTRFELPGVGIEIAKECSSIHSAWALFITGLIVGHMLLKSIASKLALSISTVPIAMFTNAIRIVAIWFLGTHVDPGFLYGNLHRNGGILFSLISLAIVMSLLVLLRSMERRTRPNVSIAGTHVTLTPRPGAQSASLP